MVFNEEEKIQFVSNNKKIKKTIISREKKRKP